MDALTKVAQLEDIFRADEKVFWFYVWGGRRHTVLHHHHLCRRKLDSSCDTSQIVKTYHNLYIKSLGASVICVPRFTTGHLDACSVAFTVPKKKNHIGHLVSCSAATDSPQKANLALSEQETGRLKYIRKPLFSWEWWTVRRIDLFCFTLKLYSFRGTDGAQWWCSCKCWALWTCRSLFQLCLHLTDTNTRSRLQSNIRETTGDMQNAHVK